MYLLKHVPVSVVSCQQERSWLYEYPPVCNLPEAIFQMCSRPPGWASST